MHVLHRLVGLRATLRIFAMCVVHRLVGRLAIPSLHLATRPCLRLTSSTEIAVPFRFNALVLSRPTNPSSLACPDRIWTTDRAGWATPCTHLLPEDVPLDVRLFDIHPVCDRNELPPI